MSIQRFRSLTCTSQITYVSIFLVAKHIITLFEAISCGDTFICWNIYNEFLRQESGQICFVMAAIAYWYITMFDYPTDDFTFFPFYTCNLVIWSHL